MPLLSVGKHGITRLQCTRQRFIVRQLGRGEGSFISIYHALFVRRRPQQLLRFVDREYIPRGLLF